MAFQPGANLYTQGFGSRPENIEVPHYDVRAPSSFDINFPVGKWWLWTGNALYYLLSQSSGVNGTTSNWVQISNSSGAIDAVAGTTNQVTVTTAAGTATVSLPSALVAPGSVTATTSLTATSGNITATNGNLVLGTAGNKLSIATGTNSSVGVTPAMTTGAVTVTSTAVTTSSIILYSRATTGGTVGQVSITAQPTGSFTLTSTSGTETSTFNYLIIN